MNARKAVKFLDRITSGKDDLPRNPVVLQGPDEQYATWPEVEAHYLNENLKFAGVQEEMAPVSIGDPKQGKEAETTARAGAGAGGVLSQMLLDKLNFAKEPGATSPNSTPPLSPSSSGRQSSKASPEVKSATILSQDMAPVPPSLKPLLNPVVWYVQKKKPQPDDNVVFLTNSADTMHLARDFGIPTKNIHQLRSAIAREGIKTQPNEKRRKEPRELPAYSEPKTLFSYEDGESDEDEPQEEQQQPPEEEEEEEVVVFKPRARGPARATTSGRGASAGGRGRIGRLSSPKGSFSTPSPSAQIKPQIPIEEIDPDSFDRGSFRRGSTALVDTSSHVHGQFNGGAPRGPTHRGGYPSGGNFRGSSSNSSPFRGGAGRGFDRGSTRGRGRLFIP